METSVKEEFNVKLAKFLAAAADDAKTDDFALYFSHKASAVGILPPTGPPSSLQYAS